METSEVISIAFAMGLVGSLHCIGMCGPIAMTFPIGNRSLIGRLSGGVVYNLGRIFTYAALGLLIGFMGDFFITPKIQSTVSISFGVIILLSLFLPKAPKKKEFRLQHQCGDFFSPCVTDWVVYCRWEQTDHCLLLAC